MIAYLVISSIFFSSKESVQNCSQLEQVFVEVIVHDFILGANLV